MPSPISTPSRRIIIVLPTLPLPFGNAAARWYFALFKELVARGHRVTCFCGVDPATRIEEAVRLFPAPAYDLRPFAWDSGRGVMKKFQSFFRPFSHTYNTEMRLALKREASTGCDVLHIEHHWGAFLADGFADRTLVNVHYLYGIDMKDDVPETSKAKWWQHHIFQRERHTFRRLKHIGALSSRLAETIQSWAPHAEVTTVPLGLDLALYPFIAAGQQQRPPTLGLIGSFNWGPSIQAAHRLLRSLWPEIKRRVPNARLQIVGREARKALAALATGPDITLHENVPETEPYFRSTDVLLYAPGVGSGMKVKILESFAYGTPVVTNSEGVEGINARDGIHCGLANNDAGLIERSAALLQDSSRRHAYSTSARELVEREIAPAAVLPRLEKVYEGIIASAPTSAAGGQP